MDNFDLLGALKTFATSKGYYFVAGDAAYQNASVDQTFTSGKYILGAEFTAAPKYSENGANKLYEIVYTGVLMFGIKFDATGGTVSNLDETVIQKHERRLKLLLQTLAGDISTFACNNSLSISNVSMPVDINRFDENIDCVLAQITFIQ